MGDGALGILLSDPVKRCSCCHTVDSHQNHAPGQRVRGVLICVIKPTELQHFFVVGQNTQVRDPLPAAHTVRHSTETSTDSHVFQWVRWHGTSA